MGKANHLVQSIVLDMISEHLFRALDTEMMLAVELDGDIICYWLFSYLNLISVAYLTEIHLDTILDWLSFKLAIFQLC